MNRIATLLFTTLLATIAWAQTSPGAPAAKDVVPLLREGGYVLYLRHPQTDPNQADTDTLHLENVKAQRQLTPTGEAQAKALGEALRALQIPIGSVQTSAYARAKETARIAGLPNATSSLDLSEPQNVPPVEAKRRAGVLRTLLSTPPTAGTNTVLVGHRPNLQEAVGKEVGDMQEAEIVIFRPLGEKGFEIVARVAPVETWTLWAKDAGAK